MFRRARVSCTRGPTAAECSIAMRNPCTSCNSAVITSFDDAAGGCAAFSWRTAATPTTIQSNTTTNIHRCAPFIDYHLSFDQASPEMSRRIVAALRCTPRRDACVGDRRDTHFASEAEALDRAG